jgi:hypothetical protein
MQVVGERRLPEAAAPSPLEQMISTATATTTPSNLQTEYVARAAWKQGLIGALNALSVILAVRLTLLVAVCGAIALAYLALQQADPYRLAALGIYAAVVCVPLVWLAARR